MSLSIIIWIIIGICAIASLILVIRRWNELVSLDTSKISQEKYAQIKHRILEERVKRKTSKLFHPFKLMSGVAANVYENLKKWEVRHKRKKQLKLIPTKAQEQIRTLLAQADNLVRQDDLVNAEKKYIDILTIDSKYIKAYKGLGNLYEKKKDKKAAIEVYSHITLLDPTDHEVLYTLAELLQDQGQIDQARVYLQKALGLEANNPKYLHLMIELSMLMKDTKQAKEALEVLKSVNPDNKQIPEWDRAIKQLEG